jgi:hypothetical protein
MRPEPQDGFSYDENFHKIADELARIDEEEYERGLFCQDEEDEEDEEYEDDGQPDEAQEWASFDPDC